MQGTLSASQVQKSVHEMFLSYSSDNILEMLKVKENTVEITVIYNSIKFTSQLTKSNIKIKLESTVDNDTFAVINNSLKKLQDKVFHLDGGLFDGVYEYDHDKKEFKNVEQEESTEETETIVQVEKAKDTKVHDAIGQFRSAKSKPLIINDETGEVISDEDLTQEILSVATDNMNKQLAEEFGIDIPEQSPEEPKQSPIDTFMEEINAEPVQELPTVTLDEFEPIEQVSLFDETPTVEPIVIEPAEQPKQEPMQETATEPQPTTEEAIWADLW